MSKYTVILIALGINLSAKAFSWHLDQTSSTSFEAVHKKTLPGEGLATEDSDTRYLTGAYTLVGDAQKGFVNQKEGGGVTGGVDLNGRKYYQGRYLGAWQYMTKRSSLGLQWSAGFSRDETIVSSQSLLSQQDALQRFGVNPALYPPQQKEVIEDGMLQALFEDELDLAERWKVTLSHAWQQDNYKTGIIGAPFTRQVDTVVQLSRLQSDYQVAPSLVWTMDASYATSNGPLEHDIYTEGTRLQGDLPLVSSLTWLWSLGYTVSCSGSSTKDHVVGLLSLGESLPNQRYGYRLDVGRSIMRSVAEGQVRPENEQRSSIDFVTRNKDVRSTVDPPAVGHDLYLVDEQSAVFTYDLSEKTRSTLRIGHAKMNEMFQGDYAGSMLSAHVESLQASWGWHRELFGSLHSRLSGGANLQLSAETLDGDNGSQQQQLSATVFYDMLF